MSEEESDIKDRKRKPSADVGGGVAESDCGEAQVQHARTMVVASESYQSDGDECNDDPTRPSDSSSSVFREGNADDNENISYEQPHCWNIHTPFAHKSGRCQFQLSNCAICNVPVSTGCKECNVLLCFAHPVDQEISCWERFHNSLIAEPPYKRQACLQQVETLANGLGEADFHRD